MSTLKIPSRVYAAILLCGFGFGGIVLNTRHSIGTLAHMGPGFFPAAVFGVLMVLGIAIAMIPDRKSAEDDTKWRAIAAVIGSILVFALAVTRLGIFLTIPITIITALRAEQRFSISHFVGLSIVLTTACYAIFIYGLKIQMPLWPWR